MLDLNNKYYSKLTAKERVNLALAAFSRGDDNEIARLRRTCPQKIYTMMDYEYTSQIEALVWIVLHFSEVCESSHRQIILCQACITIFNFLEGQPQYLCNDIKENLESFSNAKTLHVSQLKSAYQALHEFCSDNSLNYEHIMEWIKISPELVAQYDDYLKLPIQPDNERTALIKQTLLSIWQRCVSR